MSIATFESPQVASQQFFPWVFEEEADYRFSDHEPAQEFDAPVDAPVDLASHPLAPSAVASSLATSSLATETRLGMPVRLGAVMLKLLKSYGITDEEIAEGLAAYAAKSGAQAG